MHFAEIQTHIPIRSLVPWQCTHLKRERIQLITLQIKINLISNAEIYVNVSRGVKSIRLRRAERVALRRKNNSMKDFWSETNWKRPLWREMSWKDNIKMDGRKTGCENAERSGSCPVAGVTTISVEQCCPTFLYTVAHLTDGCGGAGAAWRLQ
jgi:hypothetical protein